MKIQNAFLAGILTMGITSTAAASGLTVLCYSGATVVSLYSSEAVPVLRPNPQEGEGAYTGLQSIEVKADGFTIASDLADLRIENGKMTFQTMTQKGLMGTAVTLSKNKQKAQLVTVEEKSAVKKKLDCVVVK